MDYKSKYFKYKQKYYNLKMHGGVIPSYECDKKPYSDYIFVMNNRIISRIDEDKDLKYLTFDSNFVIIPYDKINLVSNINFDKIHLLAHQLIKINPDNEFPFHACFLNRNYNLLSKVFDKRYVYNKLF
jgi:hypothetical protein